jgi:hypothetical protein
MVIKENSNLLRNVGDSFPIDKASYIRRFHTWFKNRLFKYNIEFWKMSLQQRKIMQHKQLWWVLRCVKVCTNKCTITVALIIINSPVLHSLLTSNPYRSLRPKPIRKISGAQTPGAWSPWQQNFVRWRLKFTGLQYVTYFMLPFWRLECWYGS